MHNVLHIPPAGVRSNRRALDSYLAASGSIRDGQHGPRVQRVKVGLDSPVQVTSMCLIKSPLGGRVRFPGPLVPGDVGG